MKLRKIGLGVLFNLRGFLSKIEEVSLQQSLLFSDSLKDLKKLRTMLYSEAEYLELWYTNDDKKQIGGNIEILCHQRSVNIVDHLGSVTCKVNDPLNAKVDEVSDAEH
ncbi:hypothetical protein CICLE_v10023724mg [Citrus x clementina]|uniref:Rx N-terminal domain-containing protein n=1 Tax=Citrus clementina TaxID=85681 RepID=V4T2E1_CITCL|nr:hypothetical protein CICLE_v10023724mg [Citrus x clementina]